MATNRTPRTPRQQSLPGTEPEHPQIAAAIEDWQDALESQAAANERATAANDAIVTLQLAIGNRYYPYVDRKTGKRKYRILDTSPRGKSVANRAELPGDISADEASVSESEPVGGSGALEVEHRRVPRQAVEDELAVIAEETRRADDADALTPPAVIENDGFVDRGTSPYAEDDDATPVEEIEEEPPVLDDLQQRTVLLEVEDKPTPIDPELRAQGKCALRFEGTGKACEREIDHRGLHDSGIHKWKARMPREVES